jgi:hypothetical protein
VRWCRGVYISFPRPPAMAPLLFPPLNPNVTLDVGVRLLVPTFAQAQRPCTMPPGVLGVALSIRCESPPPMPQKRNAMPVEGAVGTTFRGAPWAECFG